MGEMQRHCFIIIAKSDEILCFVGHGSEMGREDWAWPVTESDMVVSVSARARAVKLMCSLRKGLRGKAAKEEGGYSRRMGRPWCLIQEPVFREIRSSWDAYALALWLRARGSRARP